MDSIIQDVKKRMVGWAGAGGSSLPHVWRHVNRDGNHVEIGSLFGASAVVAALSKKENGREGMVYAIDPMEYARHEPSVRDPYEKDALGMHVISKELAERQKDIFVENIHKFGVDSRIVLVNKPSLPWPVGTLEFTSIFIDGWHYGNGPINDAKVAACLTRDVIILDDVVEAYPAVLRAFFYLCRHQKWFLQEKTDRVAVYRGRQDIAPLWGRRRHV